MSETYRVPVRTQRTEITVVNSRFITTIGPAYTAEEAKTFRDEVRQEMPDASHHVYAFRVGYGNSVVEGMSDDGEPSGTSGPPTLAVLRGTDIGDVVVVTTRYFGGTKLGTGGLVRAYSEAARIGLNNLKTVYKVDKKLLGMELPYSIYESAKRLIYQHGGEIDDEVFAGEVTVFARFPVDAIPGFRADVKELSAGSVALIDLSEA